MHLWPALDVRPSPSAPEPMQTDFVLAALDPFAPTAVEEHETGVRVFFATGERRDAARADLTAGPLAQVVDAVPIDVSDEDWAVRSQQDLEPVHVGRISIYPSPEARSLKPEARSPGPDAIRLVVRPSMGFGTGHHATTRLCLEALQTIDLRGASVLDIGTGSGVLAIAAVRLGAARALGIDADEDALQAARETLTVNPDARGVTFDAADVMTARLPTAGVVTANLTGALLVRAAGRIAGAVSDGGTLIVSGVLAGELAEVRAAYPAFDLVARSEDGEWTALVLRRPHSTRDPRLASK